MKTVLITGATDGIGRETARGLLAKGWHVHVHGRSRPRSERAAAELAESGGQTTPVWGDLSRMSEVVALAQQVLELGPRLDVLINNAGGLIRRTPVEDYDEALQQAVLDLNINHVVRFMREGALTMRAQGGGGAIVNVASIAGRTGGGPGSVLYAAAKGYIATATRGWAKELVKDGIRVNAVSPGVIATPFHDRFTTAEQLAAMRTAIPMGRLGEAWECAGAFLFLSSNALSSYVTGQMLEVNGGQFSP